MDLVNTTNHSEIHAYIGNSVVNFNLETTVNIYVKDFLKRSILKVFGAIRKIHSEWLQNLNKEVEILV